MAILDRFRRLWNAFTNQPITFDGGTSVSGNYRSSGFRYRYSNDKTIVTSVYTRIAMDVSGVLIKHVLLDENGRYKDDAPSQLNRCLMLEANIDQAPQAFRQDIAMTLFENGTAAIVPIASERDPLGITIRDVSNMRVGDVTEFLTQHVRLNVWNEAVGRRQEIVMSKKLVAIVNNPLSAIMNEPNSTLQRLIRKLSLLDTVDEASSSGKLDLIIQLPYTVKTEIKRQQAEQRRELIETHLNGSRK